MFICRGLGNESGRGIMVVFDLNCWYHCQMPLHPCWSPADKPGYGTYYHLIDCNYTILDAKTVHFYQCMSCQVMRGVSWLA